ncbi:beta-microseminoprotein-like isoform X1 [Pezoporus flaviventris]|uniref:beta-microseminoprotein-like isoform X1 n=1 Tax=Pezoporus flaviventris TaxID=889875 RepID=UPI002AB1090F|nr:beta-microseminoprotein-like isoform X1 [Pezoporus flaviventris]
MGFVFFLQKSFLAFLVAMGITVSLGDAYCFSKINKPEETNKGCVLDGKLYPYGEITRTENCFRCHCSKTHIQCCSLFHTPLSYDRESCRVIFNKKTCDYEVVQKSDPTKECNSYSRVG